jgi:hypothetical protein
MGHKCTCSFCTLKRANMTERNFQVGPQEVFAQKYATNLTKYRVFKKECQNYGNLSLKNVK